VPKQELKTEAAGGEGEKAKKEEAVNVDNYDRKVEK
jgi:hypothetical protein